MSNKRRIKRAEGFATSNLLDLQRRSRDRIVVAVQAWAALARTGSEGTTQQQIWHVASTNRDGVEVMVKLTLEVWARECPSTQDGIHHPDRTGGGPAACMHCGTSLARPDDDPWDHRPPGL